MAINKTNLEYYLHRVGANSLENASISQIKKVFLFSVKFFKDGEISLDRLSSIASVIWPTPSDTDSELDEELINAIHSCAEINFYIRKIPEIDVEANSTKEYLLDTFKYFDKYKSFIE